MTKEEILKQCKENDVEFLRLQFTDIFGVNKNVEIILVDSGYLRKQAGELKDDRRRENDQNALHVGGNTSKLYQSIQSTLTDVVPFTGDDGGGVVSHFRLKL